MKWAKSKKEIDARKVSIAERRVCFHEFVRAPMPSPANDPPPPVIDIDGKPFYLWVIHSLDIAGNAPSHDRFNYNQRAQENYELFCGGWLQFYDHIVRDGETDTIMYFFWKQYESVSIYINNPNAQDKTDKTTKVYTIKLPYKEPPPSGDPPDVPPPPPPSSFSSV